MPLPTSLLTSDSPTSRLSEILPGIFPQKHPQVHFADTVSLSTPSEYAFPLPRRLLSFFRISVTSASHILCTSCSRGVPTTPFAILWPLSFSCCFRNSSLSRVPRFPVKYNLCLIPLNLFLKLYTTLFTRHLLAFDKILLPVLPDIWYAHLVQFNLQLLAIISLFPSLQLCNSCRFWLYSRPPVFFPDLQTNLLHSQCPHLSLLPLTISYQFLPIHPFATSLQFFSNFSAPSSPSRVRSLRGE